MAQKKPKVRIDRLIGAVILFLLFIIVILWILGVGSKDDSGISESTAATEETFEPIGTVFLSPSNQEDNAYAAGDTNEAKVMRELSALVREKLEKKHVLVYEAKEGVTLKDKVLSANELKADAYVAIHSNAGEKEEYSKVEGTVCYYNPNIKGSRVLAEYIYEEVAGFTPNADQGIKEGTDTSNYLYEIDKAASPICLIEVEYHNTQKNAQWILDNLDALAEHIATGIIKYIENPNISSSQGLGGVVPYATAPTTETTEPTDTESDDYEEDYYYGDDGEYDDYEDEYYEDNGEYYDDEY